MRGEALEILTEVAGVDDAPVSVHVQVGAEDDIFAQRAGEYPGGFADVRTAASQLDTARDSVELAKDGQK